MSHVPNKPDQSAKSETGNFDDFVTRLLAVPHSEIKAQLDAEREAKRTSKAKFEPLEAFSTGARSGGVSISILVSKNNITTGRQPVLVDRKSGMLYRV